MAAITVYACYTVKIYKYKPPKKFQIWGWAPGTLVLDPPLLVTLGNRDIKLNVSTEGIPFLPKSIRKERTVSPLQVDHKLTLDLPFWPIGGRGDKLLLIFPLSVKILRKPCTLCKYIFQKHY